MKPYYDQDGITIYHGDARELLPRLPRADVIITDPVWPNAVAELFGADDPIGMFTQIASHFPTITDRVIVQLGVDSDPRFLAGIPTSLPFFRVCWLEYCTPNHKGRLLYTGDVAYAFGSPPQSRRGRHVIPGRFLFNNSPSPKPLGHPCARQLSHVQWLVKWFADGLIIDPTCGIGTTLEAAKLAGLPAIGIEIEERYCEAAANRLAQGVLFNADIGAEVMGGVRGRAPAEQST